jgi:hypothetical protein
MLRCPVSRKRDVLRHKTMNRGNTVMFKRVAIRLLVCLPLLIIAVGCVSWASAIETPEIPSDEAVEPPGTELEAAIAAAATLSAGEAANLRFTLINNADTRLYVLKWYIPLEGIAGEIFRVERDGQIIPYQGILAMRATPLPEDYVLLEPGESVSAEVNLATAYDLSEPGKYTISFISPRISHVARTEGEMASSVDDLGPVQMPSNDVVVEIHNAGGEK